MSIKQIGYQPNKREKGKLNKIANKLKKEKLNASDQKQTDNK